MAAKSPEDFMRRAVRLSKRGYPAPNPHVGCVVVQNGRVVGEGFHSYAGGPHAEVVALKQAGKYSEGADVYVTLEPCNHHGRTSPCSLALIQAGVRRVFFACDDPNPAAKGGARELESAGIEVHAGLCQSEAAEANVAFLASMNRKRPYVVAKVAMGLDGRIALPGGESKWITGTESRRAGQLLRAELGAVLVGARTVAADSPRLTVRVKTIKNQPLRIVLDFEGSLDVDNPTFDSAAQTIRFVQKGMARSCFDVEAPASKSGFELDWILSDLHGRGCTGLLIEGGAHTIGSFFRAGLVDGLELFVAPRILGAGMPWITESLGEHLENLPRLRIAAVKRLGSDLRISCQTAP